MWIYDYHCPTGRELKPKPPYVPDEKVRVRFWTAEERRYYLALPLEKPC